MTGQRTWRRVEAPGTFRGHALTAAMDGRRFTGWENRDGTWSLSVDGSPPVRCEDWSEARRLAEGQKENNPLDALAATAAASGMAMAMRHFLMSNPRRTEGDAELVLHVVPLSWLARRPRRDHYGNVWLLAKRGFRGKVARATRRARLPFPVQIMEAP